MAPASTVKRQKNTTVIIGVDVGGTHLSGGLVTREGHVLSVLDHPTHEHGHGTAVEQMLGVIRALHAQARQQRFDVEGVGVGVPGIVDTDKGMMVGDVYLVPELAKFPVVERVHEVTGLPVVLDNDVNALGLAEHRWGAGRGCRSLVLLALGSGPGGAVILNGDLVRGRNGYGGEFGHVPIFRDGPRCPACNAPGCAAISVGGEMIARQARQAVRQHGNSQILALAGGNVNAVTARTVFEAARLGDDTARAFVDRACEALAVVLGIVLNSLNPDVLVVTGGMVPSLLPLEGEILRRAACYAFARVFADTTIRFVSSSKQDTVRGGAALFLYERERRSGRSHARRL
jgi:glucokinase